MSPNILSTVPSYPKSGLKRDYGHREELHPRSRAAIDYSSRATSDRRPPYRDDYPPRASSYSDVPRGGASRSTARRAYVDDGYSQRYERPPPTYQEGRGREYVSMSGSKRPYAAVVISGVSSVWCYVQITFLILCQSCNIEIDF